jgi:uncharacterized protein YecT (DUF1311 family)
LQLCPLSNIYTLASQSIKQSTPKMLHPKKITICLVSISSIFSLSFATPANSERQMNCKNPASTIEHKACENLASEEIDKQLNQVYKSIIAKSTGTEKQKLIKAQLSWIKFRDNNCDFEVDMNRGGTGYSIFFNECIQRMTKARTAELKNWKNPK